MVAMGPGPLHTVLLQELTPGITTRVSTQIREEMADKQAAFMWSGQVLAPLLPDLPYLCAFRTPGRFLFCRQGQCICKAILPASTGSCSGEGKCLLP